MKLSILLVIVLAVLTRGWGRITLIGSYSDDFPEVEFPRERDGCADGSCSLYTEKRMILPDKVVEDRQLMPRFTSNLESIDSMDALTKWKPICGCMTQHKLVNFGEGHYPRYVTIARCKVRTYSNKFHQCKYYDYRIHVLVKRGMSSILKNPDELDVQNVEEVALPESLHANWQMFAVSIPVACVAVERA